ncbi:ATP-binding cassette domain-containing protein [Methermicoccus shengliensis]|uniref:ABC transporter ATP-binding protein n=1 Tax=Methermicoccus shengliensis TaxID=660064 RepID=A0A832RUR0_9EURY|nr:ATP-binding cassette domain-containing protein [Methermicoccus shengliensis]KUK04728.1 MAG: ABC transporter related protein [Euryarchaeota archaeon 55_53]KUK30505.1 MAG: ABC transporter related protein [Methanosarcinales archeaon 56_1174]MDI3487412.1 methyl coenzyme reductase system, component [Methanosarcinales archaeon]HIH69652.1 ABC transporter ATP-binding protein [Methermicoccus shengliensis]
MLLVDGIVKEYEVDSRRIRALDGVSFKVDDGEILGIIGRSGGGKSTLMRILKGIEPFDGGVIDLDQRQITPDSSEGEMKWLQWATAIHLQRSFGLWTESALENVMRRLYANRYGYEALPPKDSDEYEELARSAEKYLAMVGLLHKKHHMAFVLSGGEKQRVLLARQLAKNPRLLLLDEPATMTCPKTKQEVLDTILKVREETQIPIVLVSHLPEVIAYVSDRVLWLEEGKVRAKGEPLEVLREFLSEMPPAAPLPPMRSDETLLRGNGLAKRYRLLSAGEVLNMRDIGISVRRGEILGIVGNSGGGKTTLMKMLAGVLSPDAGSVQFNLDGRWVELTTYSRERMEVRRRLGIMYQEFALSPHSTLLTQIAFRLGVKGPKAVEEARKRAVEMGIGDMLLDSLYVLMDMQPDEVRERLREMGLEPEVFTRLFPAFPAIEARKYAEPVFEALGLSLDILDCTSEHLSGGEKVRAMLALQMASNPELLILDEPFGDIDPITLREVANYMKRLNAERGTSFIIVSHHMDFMKEIAHRVVWIESGRIKAEGDPKEVCNTFIRRSGAKYLEWNIERIMEGVHGKTA